MVCLPMVTSRRDRKRLLWEDKNPEKLAAHKAVFVAIASGELVEPDPPTCESCGEVTRLVAHHEDYALQLDVNWICSYCHYWLHEGVSPAPPRKRPVPSPRQRRHKLQQEKRQLGRPSKEISPQHRSREWGNFYRCEATPLWGGVLKQCRGSSEKGKRFCERHKFWKADDKRPRKKGR